MNIWIRVLMTLLRSRFQRKIAPTAVLETNMIVGPTEADIRFVSNAGGGGCPSSPPRRCAT